jgi:hypothetical protein
MDQRVGIWIDHRKAVIVSTSEDEVTAKALKSAAEPHPHFARAQEGGGETQDEERHDLQLNRYFDAVISQLGQPKALLIFGPETPNSSSESVSADPRRCQGAS